MLCYNDFQHAINDVKLVRLVLPHVHLAMGLCLEP